MILHPLLRQPLGHTLRRPRPRPPIPTLIPLPLLHLRLQRHHLPHQLLPTQLPQLLLLLSAHRLGRHLAQTAIAEHAPQRAAAAVLEPEHRVRAVQAVDVLGPADRVAVLRPGAGEDLVLDVLVGGGGGGDLV